MNGNIEERADALIDQNIVCETQDQMRKSGAEYVQEHGSGHTHSHIDENGNVYTHSHADENGKADSHSHSHEHTGSGHHHHVHSPEEKKAVLNRLSRAIGHLESVRRMVERDEDCSDVLIQLSAVRNAINNTGKVIMKNHISHCIVEAIEQDDLEAVEALNHAIDHFIK